MLVARQLLRREAYAEAEEILAPLTDERGSIARRRRVELDRRGASRARRSRRRARARRVRPCWSIAPTPVAAEVARCARAK